MRRPPLTRRMSFALDQFLLGIFHMPRPEQRSAGLACDRELEGAAFSRSRVLSTIGAEVLAVAECLPGAPERQFWAGWVDGIFNQMKMECDMDGWRSHNAAYRGRC
jgi:hypothetical protein